MDVSTDRQQELEEAYRRDLEATRLPQGLAVAALVALACNVLFLPLDVRFFGDRVETLFSIRAVTSGGLLAIVFGLRRRHPWLCAYLVAFALGAMLLALILATGGPGTDYYAGLLLLILALPVALPLGALSVAAVTVPMVAAYACMPFLAPVSAGWQAYAVHLFILMGGALASVVMAGVLSRLRFQDFAYRMELATQNAALEKTLGELKATQVDLAQARHLASLGRLAAGIAHEISNPMAFVQANLKQLDERLEVIARGAADADPKVLQPALGEAHELVDESLEGSERVTGIVHEVKAFASGGWGERETVEIGDVLDTVLRFLTPQLAEGLRIERRFASSAPVLGARRELEQVFENLLANAAHAVGDSGTIRIATNVEPDSVAVSVEDDGCGIEEGVLQRIFDPFFTTKSVSEGTGLGLSICHQLVKGHGGSIQVESRAGEGTRVRVALPAEADPVE